MLEVHGNMTVNYLKIKGLTPDAYYRIDGSERLYAANALMEVGLPLPIEMGEYQAYQMHFVREGEGNYADTIHSESKKGN
jgi:alpha-galactosidase